MENKLSKYKTKRDFTKTPEPHGEKHKSNKKLHYVIQYHEARAKHYDFRLEWKGVLLSWAVPKGPSFNPADKRLAVHTEDHPFEYKDFEGLIPQGNYGAGTVMLFDQGYWSPLDDVEKSLKKGMLKFVVFGERIKGKFMLLKMQEDNWLLIKEKDEFAKKSSGISKFKTSIKSGKTITQIAKNNVNPFSKVDVELALLANEVPLGKNWIYEIKYDGYRIISEIENNKVTLLSRNHLDYTDKFPEITKSLLKISKGKSMILDGEVIYSDNEGKSNFSFLQKAIKNKNTEESSYVIFDILSYNGEDLRDVPLLKRKAILEKILNNCPDNIVFSKHLSGNGKALFNKAQKLSLEGIIAKKTDSLYLGKRSGNWLKIKCRKSSEFLICGYELSSKKKDNIKSLLLCDNIKNKLVYVGKVGSGISLENGCDLIKIFNNYKTNRKTFENDLKSKNIIYLKPHFIAEVEYQEFTSEGLLRQASFKGIREDKDLNSYQNKDTKKEIILSNPDKIVFPKDKITKQDIFAYYSKIGSKMLKFIKDRPLAVIRCNQGIDKAFFKKHPDSIKEGIDVFTIKSKSKETKEYFSISSIEGILNEIQLGTVEFHVWGAQKDYLNHPNYMVFDLDPDDNVTLLQLREGVKHLKKVLDSFNLKSFLKTSGGKGYHIVVPFSNVKDWDIFEKFSKNIALLMEEKWPDLYTSNMSKSKRKNKIFIDYLRNKKGSTSVAPYSLRARVTAPVSIPISWSELDKIKPNEITLSLALKRMNKNPWKNFFQVMETQTLK